MPINRDHTMLSELERELELEMDDELEIGDESDNTGEFESPGDDEAGYQPDLETGGLEVDEGRDKEFVDRFIEIAAREFEAEYELDQAMNEVLDDVAQEYLFGGILKKARRFGQGLMKNRVVGSLVRKGLSVASGQLPALKAAMQLAKGNLQGALLNLGKQAIGTAIPGGSVALGALSALGGGAPANEREVWQNYTQLARDAFEHLGDNITEAADQPIEASRLAANAFQHAVRRAQSDGAGNGRMGRPGRMRMSGDARRVQLRPGEKLIISGAKTIIVHGG